MQPPGAGLETHRRPDHVSQLTSPKSHLNPQLMGARYPLQLEYMHVNMRVTHSLLASDSFITHVGEKCIPV